MQGKVPWVAEQKLALGCSLSALGAPLHMCSWVWTKARQASWAGKLLYSCLLADFLWLKTRCLIISEQETILWSLLHCIHLCLFFWLLGTHSEQIRHEWQPQMDLSEAYPSGGEGDGFPWLLPDRQSVLFPSMPCLQPFTSITPWKTGNVLRKTTLSACR